MNTLTRRISRPAWVSAAAPILLCASLVNGGCIRMPVTGVKASGEPLVVDVSTEQRAYIAQEKTGEVVHRDATGRVVGTSEAYQDRLVQYDVTRWQVFQGNDKIDDQDFFRIAGDDQAADQIASQRARAVTVNRVGLVLLLTGAAVLGAGLATTLTVKDTDELGNEVPAPWPKFLLIGGGITAAVGGTMMWYSAAVAKREHPIDDPRRAKRVGDKYNASLGIAPPASEEEPAEKPRKKKKKKKPVETEDDE